MEKFKLLTLLHPRRILIFLIQSLEFAVGLKYRKGSKAKLLLDSYSRLDSIIGLIPSMSGAILLGIFVNFCFEFKIYFGSSTPKYTIFNYINGPVIYYSTSIGFFITTGFLVYKYLQFTLKWSRLRQEDGYVQGVEKFGKHNIFSPIIWDFVSDRRRYLALVFYVLLLTFRNQSLNGPISESSFNSGLTLLGLVVGILFIIILESPTLFIYKSYKHYIDTDFGSRKAVTIIR